MKYLFVTQYFYPEEFRGNDIAFDWARRGNSVTVLTAIPNYPSGKYLDGYGMFKKRVEVIQGVKVIRIPVIPRGKGSTIQLMLNYFSFALLGSLYAFFLSFREKYDSIFVQQLSPVTLTLPAIVMKKIQKVNLYLWVLDLWPESLTSAGNIKNKFILNFFDTFVKLLYENSDKILISSKGFEASICSKGDFKSKIIYFPNWAEDIFKEQDLNFELPALPEGFIVMFAGNIGEAQDFDNILKTVELLRDNKQIKFVILGDGRKKQWVDEYCKKNSLEDIVYCLGRYPLLSMPSFFEKADVMLVSLKNELIFNLTLPAKIQAYMTTSKPIVGMMCGEGMKTIQQAGCGFCVDASDYHGLATEILKLSKLDIVELEVLGFNGYNFANDHYNKDVLLEKLYSEIINN